MSHQWPRCSRCR